MSHLLDGARQSFERPWALSLLLAPLLISLAAWVRRRRVSRILNQRQRLGWLTEVSAKPGSFTALPGRLGLSLLVLAVAGPMWGTPEAQPTKGIDFAIVLDVSRSMLAADALPSRLERARSWLVQVLREANRRGGHQAAFITFAGAPRVASPLTPDLEQLARLLSDLDVIDERARLSLPGGSAASGTRIGEALGLAVDQVGSDAQSARCLLLISDGDDPGEDKEWLRGIDAAARAGVAIHVVGVGDPLQGSPIPLPDGSIVRHNGQEVKSRLREEPLRAIASQTGGVYVPALLRQLDLGHVFWDNIAPRTGAPRILASSARGASRSAWFFVGAAFCGICDLLLRGQRHRGNA